MALFVAKFLESAANRVRSASEDTLEYTIDPMRLFNSQRAQHARGEDLRAARDHLEANLPRLAAKNRQEAKDPRWVELVNVLQHMHSCSLSESISIIEERINEQDLKLKQVEKTEMEFLNLMHDKMKFVLSQHEIFENSLQQFDEKLSFITKNVLEPNTTHLHTKRYIDGMISGVQLSNKLHNEYTKLADCDFIDGIVRLKSIIASIPKKTACRRVLRERFRILKNRFISAKIDSIKNPKSEPEMWTIYDQLSKSFSCTKSNLVEEIILAPRLANFDYHFIRVGSPLNLLDKPEWPLRRFFEIAKEFQTRQQFVNLLARKARDYFYQYRWNHSSEGLVFSLNLTAYLSSANVWYEQFGTASMTEYMQDFVNNKSRHNDVYLLDAWIEHDKQHFQKAFDDTRNKFEPSKLNPQICNVAQTISDILIASNSRIQTIRHDAVATHTFISNCNDFQFRETVLHAFKVQARSGSGIHLLQRSAEYIITTISEYNVLSQHVRKQMIDFSNQLV